MVPVRAGSGSGSQAKLSGAEFGRGSRPRFGQEGNRTGHHGNAGRNDLPAGQERGLFIPSQWHFP
jgi:hypothetical protein